MKVIYMDNSATTPLCDAARQAMTEAFELYGNPSSLHLLGVRSERIVNKARGILLGALGDTAKGRVYFTGSGTEANNLALFGTAYAKASNVGKRIVITDSEHPSVSACASELEKRGFQIVRIPTENGIVNEEALLSSVDGKTFLVSIMTVNNESGAEYDIKRLVKLCKRVNPDVIFHTDATQAFMKAQVNAKLTGADLITVSGHKIGAPKGIGALYVSGDVIKRKAISPHIFGGGQEGGIRSGTENVIHIHAFGAAVEYGMKNYSENLKNTEILRKYAVDALRCLDGVRINTPKSERVSPSIISVTVNGIKSEVMLHHLESEGIYVSSGSACSSHHKGVSQAMTAFGLTEDESDSTIRISLGYNNTFDECDALVSSLKSGIATLATKVR